MNVEQAQLVDALRSRLVPRTPRASGAVASGQKLEGIRAVLWDVYGTMFVSGSSEPLSGTSGSRGEAARQTFQELGVTCETDGEELARRFDACVRLYHEQAWQNGVDHPEVNILAVWQELVGRLIAEKQLVDPLPPIDWKDLAIAFECRVNPVWPMPEVAETLAALRARNVILGVVSNSQFFTPLLFPALLGRSLEELGFARQYAFFSHLFGHAKPGLFLYRRAASVLRAEGIRPDEVLMVGNDMLNDVAAAAAVGFRTALWAGDAQSLRYRRGDPLVEGLEPDLVLTRLGQLLEFLA